MGLSLSALKAQIDSISQVIMSTNPSQSRDQLIPIPPEKITKSHTNSFPATISGTTKADSEMLQFYINMVEEQIKVERNPTRRHNAKVCLEYVRQHGYPSHGYRFLIHQGKMEVLTQDESMKRKKDLAREIPGCLKDSYGLHPPVELGAGAYEHCRAPLR